MSEHTNTPVSSTSTHDNLMTGPRCGGAAVTHEAVPGHVRTIRVKVRN